MASIREVAKLANVSPATVSRVMNGTANVDDEKRERVLQAIKETGFVPNEVARSLFKKSAKLIGLVIPSIENPFFTHMADAIEKEAEANGYRVVLYNTDSDFEKEKAALQMLSSMNADGIILTRIDEKLLPYVEAANIPTVITDSLVLGGKDITYVDSDHYQGGRLATEHLIECGCKKIVCIKGVQTFASARERFRGYRDVCKEHGVAECTIDCSYDFHDGLQVGEELLLKYPAVDGIIASNDMVAISIYKVLKKHNIEVPEQVQLIGFDDIELSSIMTPELSTIRQFVKEIGKIATNIIIFNQNNTSKENNYIFPVKLIVRETTKPKQGINA